VHATTAIPGWRPLRFFFIFAILAGHGDAYRYHGPYHRPARDPDLEDELFTRFVYRREVRGLKVSGRWLKKTFKEIVACTKPPGYENYRYSNRWLHRFQRRYDISSQTRSNRKHLPVFERLPEIRKFHLFLHEMRNSAPCRDEKYGRFPANTIFHMDQIPLPFALDCNRSLGRKGVPGRIFQPTGGLDKRQATLQLCIRAEGDQICLPALIFRGKGLQLSREERVFYASISDRIRVHFQPKAW
jgi:hypothetical protein